MVQVKRFELLSDAYKATRLTVDLNLHFGGLKGFEPLLASIAQSQSPYMALPLGIEPRTRGSSGHCSTY